MIANLIRLLEVIFALGLVGSGVVLLLTLIEDAKMLFEKDEKVSNITVDHATQTPATVMQ